METNRIPWGEITNTWKAYKRTGWLFYRDQLVEHYETQIEKLVSNKLNGNLHLKDYLTEISRESVRESIENYKQVRKSRKFTSHIDNNIRKAIKNAQLEEQLSKIA